MREFLKNIELKDGVKLEKEIIDSIMAEHGKSVSADKSEIDDLKNQVSDKDKEIENYKSTIDNFESKVQKTQEIQDELDSLKDKMAKAEQDKADSEKDKILTSNIESVYGDKKFVNEYTKNHVTKEIKEALKDPNNLGKSAKDIFEELTKDQEGIFVNPNAPIDMPNQNPNINTQVTKDAFNKMNYNDRLELKQKNPDLYNSFVDAE